MMSINPSKPTILVIDDEVQIRRLLRLTMEDAGYAVREAETGQAGLDEVARDSPDAIILDLGLPDMTGMELLRQLRGWSNTPVLILSVFGQEKRKIAGLDAGADDYLTKPFSSGELLARLRSLLRRIKPSVAAGTFGFGDIAVDLGSRRVTKKGDIVKLTSTEYGAGDAGIRDRRGLSRWPGQPFGVRGCDAIEHELHGDRRQQQAHDADGNVQRDGAQPLHAMGRNPQDDIGGGRNRHDTEAQRDLLGQALRLVLQENDRGNGPGAGEHGDGQRGDGNVEFLDSGGSFFPGFQHPRALRPQHVERDQQQHNAGGNLEGRHGDAEKPKNPTPCQGKGEQDTEHDQGRQPGHADAVGGGVRRRHCDKRRHRRQRIHDHKQRTGRQKDVFMQGHAARDETGWFAKVQCHTGPRPFPGCP